jgi:predicted methyltransferase
MRVGLSAAAFLAAALAMTACTAEPQPSPPALEGTSGAVIDAAPIGSLDWAIAGPWRLEPDRDVWRHPKQTLTFFGLAPGQTVVEVMPGRGWYTAILAPYLARNGGRLIVAGFASNTDKSAQRALLAEFNQRFADASRFGQITISALGPDTGPIAPDDSADLVIVARNVHTFMIQGYAEKAFADFFRVLKPGGILGVEQHRASPVGLQDPTASDGYVQEAYVKMLAEEAGFVFVGSTDVNANPKDTRNHQYGVWTLPPILRTAPLGQPPDPSWDTRPYEQVGESDRMTLKFRKPAMPANRAAQRAPS